jgi:peptidoglycan hydrolase CwlO-like protein
MSPTLSELQDVLDWEAIVVLRAIDDAQGASVTAVTETTGLERETVTSRCQQLSTLGLLTDAEDSDVYEVTGMGHGAIGEGLYDEYEMVGEADIDELAAEVADLLDRRETIESELERLREDADEIRTRARQQFGDREDVAAEFESLLADIDALADRLAE